MHEKRPTIYQGWDQISLEKIFTPNPALSNKFRLIIWYLSWFGGFKNLPDLEAWLFSLVNVWEKVHCLSKMRPNKLWKKYVPLILP